MVKRRRERSILAKATGRNYGTKGGEDKGRQSNRFLSAGIECAAAYQAGTLEISNGYAVVGDVNGDEDESVDADRRLLPGLSGSTDDDYESRGER